MGSYDAAMLQMKTAAAAGNNSNDNLLRQDADSLNFGEAAAHLAWKTMKDAEILDNSRHSAGVSVGGVGAVAVASVEKGGMLHLPQLTEEEKNSPLGASMGYLTGLFFSLREKLMMQRSKDTNDSTIAGNSEQGSDHNNLYTFEFPSNNAIRPTLSSSHAGSMALPSNLILNSGPTTNQSQSQAQNFYHHHHQSHQTTVELAPPPPTSSYDNPLSNDMQYPNENEYSNPSHYPIQQPPSNYQNHDAKSNASQHQEQHQYQHHHHQQATCVKGSGGVKKAHYCLVLGLVLSYAAFD